MSPARRGWLCRERSRAPGKPRLAARTHLLPDQTGDLSPVRAALRLPHHEPDERPDGLHVARADLLRRRGIGGDRPGDDLVESVANGAERAQVLALDDLAGIASLLNQPG